MLQISTLTFPRITASYRAKSKSQKSRFGTFNYTQNHPPPLPVVNYGTISSKPPYKLHTKNSRAYFFVLNVTFVKGFSSYTNIIKHNARLLQYIKQEWERNLHLVFKKEIQYASGMSLKFSSGLKKPWILFSITT